MEVSHLQRLTDVRVIIFGDSSALLCSLPSLERLRFEDLDEPLFVPPTLTSLIRLTSLHLSIQEMEGNIQAFSQLSG